MPRLSGKGDAHRQNQVVVGLGLAGWLVSFLPTRLTDNQGCMDDFKCGRKGKYGTIG